MMPVCLKEYQRLSAQTAIYPTDDLRVELLYLAVGLAGEAGEVAGKVKKWVRRGGDPDELPALLEMVNDEGGDALWYLTRLVDRLGGRMEDMPLRNLDKLLDRKDRGVLEGSGDKR